MLVCPKCQSPRLLVCDSRSWKNNDYFSRRRKCKECGHRFSTVEIDKDEYEELNLARQKLNMTFRWETNQEGNVVCGRCKKPHLRTINGAHLLSPFCPECGADLRASKKLGSFSPLEYRLR